MILYGKIFLHIRLSTIRSCTVNKWLIFVLGKILTAFTIVHVFSKFFYAFISVNNTLVSRIHNVL